VVPVCLLFTSFHLTFITTNLYAQNCSWFTPSPVQKQYVIQGMEGRCLVAGDATDVVFVVFRDASQPVNLSVNHRLTCTWFVPLSLGCTWFVPLPVCDHSYGVYFPPNRRRSLVFGVLFQQTNKQTNKQTTLGLALTCMTFLTIYTMKTRYQLQRRVASAWW